MVHGTEEVSGSRRAVDVSYRVEPGHPINLADLDAGATEGYTDKRAAEKEAPEQTKRIEALQERLYAENSQSLPTVLQAIDMGGKDGTIRHVFSGVNPQGCRVWSFKQPSAEEKQHDFLWRYHRRAPERGMVAALNRRRRTSTRRRSSSPHSGAGIARHVYRAEPHADGPASVARGMLFSNPTSGPRGSPAWSPRGEWR